jgi:hypothetical protein
MSPHADTRSAAREETAARLLKASAQHSYDPEIDLAWDAPLLDGVYYCPPHRVSLYGTGLWRRMGEEQRVELSRREVASVASIGIWFEMILMQMLVRHVYDLKPTEGHVQFALTEVADECRHSVMFARMIAKFGLEPYPVRRFDHQLGRFLKTVSRGPRVFAAALVVEEVLDSLQREAMADTSIQPLVRMVSRIHVVEEARHVRYARDELARDMATVSRPMKEYTRLVLARAAYLTWTGLINPRVYGEVGLDVAEARAAARANPHFHETMRWSARKLVEFFTELDLIGGPGEALWRRAHFL